MEKKSVELKNEIDSLTKIEICELILKVTTQNEEVEKIFLEELSKQNKKKRSQQNKENESRANNKKKKMDIQFQQMKNYPNKLKEKIEQVINNLLGAFSDVSSELQIAKIPTISGILKFFYKKKDRYFLLFFYNK